MADWDSSWTSFYTKLLKAVHKLDPETNRRWEELDRAMETTVNRAIPRLLGSLSGRQAREAVSHPRRPMGGEQWDGPADQQHIHLRLMRLLPHHEMAVGMWRVEHHGTYEKKYREAYFKQFKPDEPVEECDDRNFLYSVKERLMYSAHVRGSDARARGLEDLQYLIGKFGRKA